MARAIIFDFNRTLFDPETGALYEGVLEMLEELCKERRLFLYSRQEGGRDGLIKELGIAPYFEEAYFTDNKSAESMRAILRAHGLTEAQCFVVGDYITSELQAGHDAGLETVWLRHGRFKDVTADFEPTHTVGSHGELQKLLRRLD